MRANRFAFLAFVVVSQVASGQPADAPWPMVHYDRWGTARQPNGPDPSKMRTPWLQFRLTPGDNDLISHAPAIAANGIVYYGSWLSNKMRKVDSNTGAVLGEFDALEWIKSTPALGNDGTLFFNVPQTHNNVPGRLYAVDPNIMDFVWFYNTAQTSLIDFDHCSPIVGPDGGVLTGSTTGSAFRFSSTGSVLWETPGLGVINFSLAMTRDDTKVIVPNGNKITALNFSDGTVAWTFNAGFPVGTPGVAPDGTVVFGSDEGTVYGLNPDTGGRRWQNITLDKVRGAPAFSSTNAYVGSFDKRLYSYRLADGVQQWSVITHNPLMEGAIVGSDGRIYVNGQSGEITSVSAAGQVVWQIDTTRQSRSSMSMDDRGRLFVPGASNGNGVMVISQAFFNASPFSAAVVRGQTVSGGLAEILETDQNYLRVKNGLTTGPTDAPIQIVVDVAAPAANLARMDLNLVAGISAPNISQKIEALKWSTNTYVQLDTSIATLADSTRTVTRMSNLAQFLNGSNGMKFRISYIPNGPTTTGSYQARIDSVKFEFSPAFAP